MEQLKSPLQVLQEARRLIADPKHWIKRTSACDAQGLSVPWNAETAECFCLGGAITRAALYRNPGPALERGQLLQSATVLVTNALEASGFPMTYIPTFNDHPNTMHQDVLRVLDDVIVKLEKEPVTCEAASK